MQQVFCMKGVDDFIFVIILLCSEGKYIHTWCLCGQHCAGHLVLMDFVTLVSRPLHIFNFQLITPNYPVFSSLYRYFQSTNLNLLV